LPSTTRGVGDGLELVLGNEAKLLIEPWLTGVRLRFADRLLYLPLGPLKVGNWSIGPADGWLVVSAPEERAPYLGELRAEPTIELCRGDELREHAGGSVRVRVAG
jgi:hypothetical protein